MKIQKLLVATVLVGGLAAVPAWAEDITLEFTVWNYSLDTIQDNAKKFEAENPGIKVNITDYTWQDYHDSHGAPLPRRHADRHRLCRAGLAAGLGGGRVPRAARRHRAGGRARPISRPTWRRLRAQPT